MLVTAVTRKNESKKTRAIRFGAGQAIIRVCRMSAVRHQPTPSANAPVGPPLVGSMLTQ
jgi:hypothetical protein